MRDDRFACGFLLGFLWFCFDALMVPSSCRLLFAKSGRVRCMYTYAPLPLHQAVAVHEDFDLYTKIVQYTKIVTPASSSYGRITKEDALRKPVRATPYYDIRCCVKTLFVQQSGHDVCLRRPEKTGSVEDEEPKSQDMLYGRQQLACIELTLDMSSTSLQDWEFFA